MNDFEKKLIQLGFIPVDTDKFINLIESLNRIGNRTRFVVTIEKLRDSFYKYSENSWEDERFTYFSYSFNSNLIEPTDYLVRRFGEIK
jgi:hypothetical protein